MNVTRFCKDCRYYDHWMRQQRCMKIVKYTDVVTGKLVYEWARFARSPDGPCGPTGLFYEPTAWKMWVDEVLVDPLPEILRKDEKKVPVGLDEVSS